MSVGGPRDVTLALQKTLEAAKAQKAERARWDVEHDAFAASLRQVELPVAKVADAQKAAGRRVDEEKRGEDPGGKRHGGRAHPGDGSGGSAADGGGSGSPTRNSVLASRETEEGRVLDVRG